MDESSLKKSFGLRCRQLRDQTGLSQEKLALLINMDRSYYASIETGLRNVTLMRKHKHSLFVKDIDALSSIDILLLFDYLYILQRNDNPAKTKGDPRLNLPKVAQV